MAERLRVAQVVPTYLPVLGGKECYVWNVVEHLPEFDFEVLTARVPGLPPPRTGPNVRVHRARPTEWFRGPYAFPSVGRTVLLWGALSYVRLHRQRRASVALGCQVVHSHWSDVDAMAEVRGLLPPRGRERLFEKVLAATTFPQPSVYTDHSILVQEMPDHLRRLMEHVLRTHRLLVCVEPEGADRARALRDEVHGSAEIEYLPNSIDTGTYRPREADRPPATVCYFGRANKAHWFVEAVCRLLPDQRFLLAIAGYSRSMAKWRAMRSDRVEVLENVPPDRLPDLLARADLVVNPLFHHAMTRVTLESLAMGIPVVADTGLSRYPLVHGRTGLLVEPRPEAFAAAMRDLLANPSLLRDYGKEGRRIVEREFSNGVILPKLAARYRRLAA